MSDAIGTNAKLGYIKEIDWGVTPAATALQLVRATSVTPTHTKTTTQSQETITAREVQDYIPTDQKGSMSFNFEWSAGNLDDILANCAGSDWVTNVLKIGDTRQSHSVEVQFSDIAQNVSFTGSVYNALSGSIKKGSVLNGSASFLSKFPVWSATSIGSGDTAAPTNTVMDPIGSVQLLQDGGSGSIAGPQEFTFNLANQLIEFPVIGQADNQDIQLGQFTLKGTLSTYLADRTYIDKFVNFTDSSIAWTIGGASTHKYAFVASKIKYSNIDVSGIQVNSAVILKADWMAKFDATDTTLMITRTA